MQCQSSEKESITSFVRRSGRCCKSVSCAAQTPAQKGLVYPGEILQGCNSPVPGKNQERWLSIESEKSAQRWLSIESEKSARWWLITSNFILCGEKLVLAKMTPEAVRLQFQVSTAPLRSSTPRKLCDVTTTSTTTTTTTTTRRTPWTIRVPSFLYTRQLGRASVWYLLLNPDTGC